MSDVDVERQLADYFEWLDGEMGSVRAAVIGDPVDSGGGTNRRRSSAVWLAGAATLLVVVAGLAMIVGREGHPGTVTAPVPSDARGLGEVDVLHDDDWLIARVVPVGVEFVVAQREPRTVRYEGETDRSVYAVMVERARDGGDDVDVEPVEGRSDEVLGGHTWEVSWTDEVWIAARRVGSSTVTAIGPGRLDDAARAFVDGLVVVVEADLPAPPLDVHGDLPVVARFDEGDAAMTLRAGGTERYFCLRFSDTAGTAGGVGGSGGCSRFGPDSVIAGVFTGSGPATGGITPFVAGGAVRSDVALVEIELVGGRVLTATPTDLSGQFTFRFWVISGGVEGDVPVDAPGRSPGRHTSLIAEVRAHDDSGSLIAAEPLG